MRIKYAASRVIEITFSFVSTSLDPAWRRIQAAYVIYRPRRVREFRNDNVRCHLHRNRDNSNSNFFLRHFSRPPDITKISQFATLVSAASANAPASALMLHAVAPTPIAPAAAILGLSFFFVKWLFDAVLENR